jgi:TRAP-type mannitol/chloroaromatic compound transport system permease small subunit
MCFVISYFSYDFISSSWAIKEASAEYNGMPGVFILKSFLWVFCVTLLIQAIAGILKSIHQLRS